MPRRRGQQRLMAMSLHSANDPVVSASQTTSPLTKVVALWAPRQFLTSTGIDVKGLLSDVNRKVEQRGFILWDGQILVHPISATEWLDEIFEGDHPFEPIAKRQWESEQKAYFGLENPYQMCEDRAIYTQSHIVARVPDSYLAPTERIAAILHGEKDEYYFYCTCHQADVVYTTHRRLLCMGCGALHVVLREPVLIPPSSFCRRRIGSTCLMMVEPAEMSPSIFRFWISRTWKTARRFGQQNSGRMRNTGLYSSRGHRRR